MQPTDQPCDNSTPKGPDQGDRQNNNSNNMKLKAVRFLSLSCARVLVYELLMVLWRYVAEYRRRLPSCVHTHTHTHIEVDRQNVNCDYVICCAYN